MKKLTFPIPKGYQPPEGTKDGATFTESCTLRLEGGKLCLEAVGESTMKDGDDGETASEKEGGGLAARYNAAMNGGGNPPDVMPA